MTFAKNTRTDNNVSGKENDTIHILTSVSRRNSVTIVCRHWAPRKTRWQTKGIQSKTLKLSPQFLPSFWLQIPRILARTLFIYKDTSFFYPAFWEISAQWVSRHANWRVCQFWHHQLLTERRHFEVVENNARRSISPISVKW